MSATKPVMRLVAAGGRQGSDDALLVSVPSPLSSGGDPEAKGEVVRLTGSSSTHGGRGRGNRRGGGSFGSSGSSGRPGSVGGDSDGGGRQVQPPRVGGRIEEYA